MQIHLVRRHQSRAVAAGGQLKVRLSISEHAIRLARDDDSKVHVIPLNGVTLSSLHKNVSRQYAACVILHDRKNAPTHVHRCRYLDCSHQRLWLRACHLKR